MTDYYVNPITGSDANDGLSGATPLASIEYAVENKIVSGDTILLAGGTYNASAGYWKSGGNKQIVPTFTGTVNIRNMPLQTPVLEMPSDVGAVFSLRGTFNIYGVQFKNTAGIVKPFFSGYSGTINTINIFDSELNGSGISSYFISRGSSTSVSVSFKRCVVHGFYSAGGYAIVQTGGASIPLSFSSESSLYYDIGYIVNFSPTDPSTLSLKNNTFAKASRPSLFLSIGNNGTRTIKNNIFRADSTFTCPLYSAEKPDLTKWDITNNIIYIPTTADPGSAAQYITNAATGTELFPTNETNFYIDPSFTDYANNDFTLSQNSMVCGRGELTDLPDTDINGNSWSGLDVGCYRNPTAERHRPAINPSTICFVGDSIAQGSGNRAIITSVLSPVNVIGAGILGAAIGGSQGQATKWYVDRAALTWAPEYICFVTYNNNFKETLNYPANITANEAADDLAIAIKKCHYWGITPIVLGMTGTQSADPAIQVAKPTAFNDAALRQAAINGALCIPILERMTENTDWALSEASGGYYGETGLAGNVHPANAGYDFILSVVKEILDADISNYAISPAQGSIQIVFEVES